MSTTLKDYARQSPSTRKVPGKNPRSTMGTVTEVYDYLRLLFARGRNPPLPLCGRPVAKQSAQEIVDAIQLLPDRTRLLVLSPLVRSRKGTHQAVLDEIRKAGFVRARVDGQVFELEEDIQMDRYKIHTIEAVVDRLVVHSTGEDERLPGFPLAPDQFGGDRPEVWRWLSNHPSAPAVLRIPISR